MDVENVKWFVAQVIVPLVVAMIIKPQKEKRSNRKRRRKAKR